MRSSHLSRGANAHERVLQTLCLIIYRIFNVLQRFPQAAPHVARKQDASGARATRARLSARARRQPRSSIARACLVDKTSARDRQGRQDSCDLVARADSCARVRADSCARVARACFDTQQVVLW